MTLPARPQEFQFNHLGNSVALLPPAGQDPGQLSITGQRATYANSEEYGWVTVLENLGGNSGYGPLLGYLGITATTDRAKGEATMTFHGREVIRERLVALNGLLKHYGHDEHLLPGVSSYNGAIIPTIPYLTGIRDDQMPMGNDWSDRSSAYDSVHDIGIHLVAWLGLTPEARQVIGQQAANNLQNLGSYYNWFDTSIAVPDYEVGRPTKDTPEPIDIASWFTHMLQRVNRHTLTPGETARLGQSCADHIEFIGGFITAHAAELAYRS